MNIHPIVVHFPIALLIVYAIIEIISLFSEKWSEKLYVTKLTCLWIGVLWSFAALSSGEAAQELLGRSALIHTHEEWAERSHIIYVILWLFYVAKTFFSDKLPITHFLNTWFVRWLVTLFAVVWVGVLTIVWALGGAISRGVGSGDPVSDRAVKTFVGEEKGWNEEMKEVEKIEEKDDDQKDNVVDADSEAKNDNSVVTAPWNQYYTMEMIASHKDEASCWTVVNGVVYDLSAFIAKHPGGDRNILKICGIDGTAAFMRKHGGQEKPEMTLAGFEIGVLAK